MLIAATGLTVDPPFSGAADGPAQSYEEEKLTKILIKRLDFSITQLKVWFWRMF